MNWKIKPVRTNLLLIVILILNIMTALAQNKTTPNMEELKLKSKQELVQIAFDILKERQPSLVLNSDDFESSAWGNSKEIIVKFRRYIRFIPINAEPYQYYDITLNLITKQILPFESGYNFTFYTPTQEDKKKLDFIKEKVDFSNHSSFDITITENEDNYWVSKKSKTSFSKFFIDKKTGFTSGVMDGSYSLLVAKPVLESTYEREEMIQFLDVNESTRITKNVVIRMAKGILQKDKPQLVLNFDDYESTVSGDSKNTLVTFRRIIRYIPLGINPEKRFFYDIIVNLNTNKISPFDDTFESDFYIETNEDKKAIQFVKKNFGGFTPEFENTIHEGKEDYFIDLKNKYSLGKYTVNKKTGKQKTEMQASMEPYPQPNSIEDLDTLLEIK